MKRGTYSHQKSRFLTVSSPLDRPDGVGVSRQLRNGHLRHLQSVAEDAEGRARAAAASGVELRGVLIGCRRIKRLPREQYSAKWNRRTQVSNLRAQDGRQRLKLVYQDQVLEGPRGEEECVAFL